MAAETDDDVRLDKWLWAARFYKTRSLASDAIAAGHVELNGDKPKRAKALKVGDEVQLRMGPYVHTVIVRALSGRRGPASVAAGLYEETSESRKARERLAEQLRMAPFGGGLTEGRPTKKDRRDIERFRRGR